MPSNMCGDIEQIWSQSLLLMRPQDWVLWKRGGPRQGVQLWGAEQFMWKKVIAYLSKKGKKKQGLNKVYQFAKPFYISNRELHKLHSFSFSPCTTSEISFLARKMPMKVWIRHPVAPAMSGLPLLKIWDYFWGLKKNPKSETGLVVRWLHWVCQSFKHRMIRQGR